MCFTNLPVEFDENGDPYLAEEADDVEHGTDCGCGADVAIDEDDPEAAFEAVLSSVPESVHEDLGVQRRGSTDPTVDDLAPDGVQDDPAEGD